MENYPKKKDDINNNLNIINNPDNIIPRTTDNTTEEPTNDRTQYDDLLSLNNKVKRINLNTEKIVEHAASAILHTGTLIFAQYTYNFYNEIVTKFESEQIVMHRQLTPYENQLLNWARTERDHARYARFDDAVKVVTHGAQSIVYATDEIRHY